jgi:hypothetical protein
LPAWATVAIALGAALIGVAGTLGATWLGNHSAARRREEDKNEQLREKGAAVVGPLRALIIEAEPLALGIFGDSTRVEALWHRWEALRDQLAVFAALHPSHRVNELANELMKAVPSSLSATAYFVHSIEKRAGGDKDLKEATEARHSEALSAADALLAEIRGEGSG